MFNVIAGFGEGAGENALDIAIIIIIIIIIIITLLCDRCYTNYYISKMTAYIVRNEKKARYVFKKNHSSRQ
jgi:hypothetical protein